MDVYQLLEYDRWATAKLLKAVETLLPEQFIQDLAGPFSSLRQQFIHLLSVQDRYRACMAQEAVPDAIEQTLLHMVNHATYHRGQIACLLKSHGVDFAATDFILWINQQRKS